MARTTRSDLLSQLTGSEPAGDALSALLDSLPDAVVVVDAEGTVRYANSRLRSLTGYEPTQLVGRPVEMLVPEALRDIHVQHRTDYVQQPATRPMGADIEIDVGLADGRSLPAAISLSPITVDHERFVVATIRDATPRREAQVALETALSREREAAEELRELSRLRDGFLRALSHDLRSPLATMLGLSSTLEAHLERLSDEDVHDLLARINRNGQRLEQLLSDLVELDRASSAGSSIEREETDLRALARTVIDELEGPPETVVDAGEELHWVVRPAALARIVENLVRNAAKHAPSDEPVHVRFEHRPDAVVLVVEDRGPGVPEQDRERVFEPFVRGAASGETPGTGLGLSIVAQLARAHGGRAWVEDRPGGGASFRVELPAAGAADGPHRG